MSRRKLRSGSQNLTNTRWCLKFSLGIRFSSSVQAKGITGCALNSRVVRTVFQSNATPAYYCRYGQATETAHFPPPLYDGPLTPSKPPFGLVLIHLMYTKTDCTQTRYVATITFLYYSAFLLWPLITIFFLMKLTIMYIILTL